MCGRFVLTADGEEFRRFFDLLELLVDPKLLRRFNVAPTQTVGVIPNRQERRFRPARWGLVPSWSTEGPRGRPLINARAETLSDRPSFRQALARRRCLVPASGFYEWKRSAGGTIPHLVRPRGGQFFAFAGLWALWQPAEGERLASFAIVTTEANELVAPLHDRMPVILPRMSWDAWLDPAPKAPAELLPLLCPAPREGMEAFAVSDRVNSVSHDDAACLLPRAEEGA